MAEQKHSDHNSHMSPYPSSDEWNCSTFLGPFSRFRGPFMNTANGCSNPTMGASGVIQEYPMQEPSAELDESNNPYNFGSDFLPDVGSWPNEAYQTSIDPSDMFNEAESQHSSPDFMHDNGDGFFPMDNLSMAIDSLPTNIQGPSATVQMLYSSVKGMSSAIKRLSAEVVSTSLAVKSLNAKTNQIADTIGNLSETVDEIVKRERIAMERFGKFPSQEGRPSPIAFRRP